ncbi:MAG: sigma-70 family RNA polymerase sigma factor [bacterium]|nr:sigma-70 family RNA polymerase sigma factor [bacterium]
MASSDSTPVPSANPLCGENANGFADLIEAVGPASMLVAIGARLDRGLRQRVQPEDIWQETLLHAWRDRAQCIWSDLRGFRRWLLGIADHRIADARDFHSAQKRATDRERVIRPRTAGETHAAEAFASEPGRSTTPSRLAVQREQADQMQLALEGLPPELREVLRLRLFEGLTSKEVATALDLGESAVKHRYRKAAAHYRAGLRQRMRSSPDSDQEP